AWMQIIIILGAGLLGLKIFKDKAEPNVKPFSVNISKKTGLISLSILVFTLIALPIITRITNNPLVSIFDTFFRVGSLVFVAGHVVSPMIDRESVAQRLTSPYSSLAGSGIAQAGPGPVSTLSSYLGNIMQSIPGAVVTTCI